MCSAVPDDEPEVLDRARCVEAVVRGITKLADDFDITVRFDHVSAADGAITDPLTRTIVIDHTLDVGDISFLIRDLWNALTIGTHACLATKIPGPPLALVPSLRSLDEVSA